MDTVFLVSHKILVIALCYVFCHMPNDSNRVLEIAVILLLLVAQSMARAGVGRELEMVLKCAIAVAPRLLALLRDNRRIGVQGTHNRMRGCN